MNPFFFMMSYNISSNRRAPWASHVYVPSTTERCDGCDASISVLDGEGEAEIDTEGSQWMDIIGSGTAQPPFMLHERIIEQLRDAGINAFEEFPVHVTKIKSKKLRILPPPQYFWIKVSGQIDIDLGTSGISMIEQCPVCFNARSQTIDFDRFVPRPETWDGSEIFQIRNRPTPAMILCTQKVLALARTHRWTNFRFDPMDISRRLEPRWKGIDYLGKKWPPKWYPDAKETEVSQ